MEDNKEKMTPVQIVLLICSGICLFTAILLGIFMLAGVFNAENAEILNGVFWTLLLTGNLFTACGNWKKRKVQSTVSIGIWSFLLGFYVCMLIFAITK